MMKKFEEALWNLTEEKRIFKEEPMAKHTTFRVGGPAEYYLMPDRKELPEVIRCCGEYQIPYLVIGNGSNLLVSDKGMRKQAWYIMHDYYNAQKHIYDNEK